MLNPWIIYHKLQLCLHYLSFSSPLRTFLLSFTPPSFICLKLFLCLSHPASLHTWQRAWTLLLFLLPCCEQVPPPSPLSLKLPPPTHPFLSPLSSFACLTFLPLLPSSSSSVSCRLGSAELSVPGWACQAVHPGQRGDQGKWSGRRCGPIQPPTTEQWTPSTDWASSWPAQGPPLPHAEGTHATKHKSPLAREHAFIH